MLRAGVVKLTVDSGTQLGRNDMDDVRRNPNDRVCTHDPKGHNLSFPRRRESIAHSTKSTLWIETNSTIVIPAPRPTAVRPET
jgi:hypothetical protein